MVVGRVLSNRASQLGHLDLSLVVPLETGEENLPLTGLEACRRRRRRKGGREE